MTKYTPGQQYTLDGALLNEIVGGKFQKPMRGANQYGLGSNGANPPPHIQGIAVITGVNGDLYTCRFRYYSQTTGYWQEYPDDVELDCGGFWEGVSNTSPVLPGGSVSTNASNVDASGPLYGHIPQYAIGDTVPVFWDQQSGRCMPCQGSFQDVPMVEYSSNELERLTGGSQSLITDDNVVTVYVETRLPGQDEWEARTAMHWRVPTKDVGDWFDSRSISVDVYAPAGTEFRLRAFTTENDYEFAITRKHIRFEGVGRFGTRSFQFHMPIAANSGGKILEKSWRKTASVPGRFKDSPTFSGGSAAGVFQVSYDDPRDAWIVRIEADIVLGNFPTVTSSSSESFSLQSASSSSSVSSSSLSSSSSSSISSSSSSSVSSRTISSSSQSLSTSSSASSSSSSLYDGGICCVTVVTDVICNSDGTVSEVCYSVICFPRPDGFTDCVISTSCIPCDVAGFSSEGGLNTASQGLSLP